MASATGRMMPPKRDLAVADVDFSLFMTLLHIGINP